MYKGKLEGTDTIVVVKVQGSGEGKTPLWRLVREVSASSPVMVYLARCRFASAHTACAGGMAQLYIDACSSSPAHKNVCQLLGWGSKQGGDGPLAGLPEGSEVFMVHEYCGTELQEVVDAGGTIAPDLAYAHLQQLAEGGSSSATLSGSLFVLAVNLTMYAMLCVFQVCTTCTRRSFTTAISSWRTLPSPTMAPSS